MPQVSNLAYTFRTSLAFFSKQQPNWIFRMQRPPNPFVELQGPYKHFGTWNLSIHWTN